MKNKLILSIAMSSGICLNTSAAQAATGENNLAAPAATTSAKTVVREEHHGGKCAAGKCGTLKSYAASKLTHDPQGYLVRARDGKCGLSGNGTEATVAANTVTTGVCAGGVCGQ